MDETKRATRADVARMAGVSETIVSYVMGGKRYVDADKRARVLDAVAALNYRPSNAARALKGKGSRSILFIADQIANEHFSRIVAEMDRQAYDEGFLISLCANRNDDAFISQVICRDYDGIVISSISFQERRINQLTAAGLPVVLLMNRDYTGLDSGVGRIYTGLYSGARACVRLLAGQGRRGILYIDRFSRRGNFSTLQDLRLRGFVEEMAAQGLPVEPDAIITGCGDEQAVVAAVRDRLASGPPVDAIFGRNDRLAGLAMKAAQAMGYAVPQDIAVAGFDNSSLSQFISSPLTTMEIQRGKIGRAAIDMLLAMLQGEKPGDVAFETQLIERESTGCKSC